MEPFDILKKYFEGLYPNKFNYFVSLFDHLYSNRDNLNEKIEFSFLLNQIHDLSMRIGLFKIYDAVSIKNFFKKNKLSLSRLEKSLEIIEDITPELGIGFDWSQYDNRVKVYFLKLPDSPNFKQVIEQKVNNLAKEMKIESHKLGLIDMKKSYLISVDFYSNGKNNLKIYTRQTEVRFNELINQMKKNKINSKFLPFFIDQFSENEFKDITFCYKFSNDSANLKGFAMFLELEDNLNKKVEALIKEAVPEKYFPFKEAIKPLTVNTSLKYSHLGTTFSYEPNLESITAYFSPVFRGVK